MEITYKIIDAEAVKKNDAFYGEGMSKHLNLRDDGFALIAWDGETPAGFISVNPRALAYPLEHIQDAFIEIYEVHENYRRQGIGRQLATRGEEWARQAGFRQIRTHHNDKASFAIQMSHKLGYGMCPYDYWIDGVEYHGFWVVKIL